MPEIGFDEVPMRPVMRDDTVTKKKPKMTIRIAARKLPCVGMPGATARKIASSSDPTEDDDRSACRARCAAAPRRAGAGAEVLHALAERRDDRRDRAAERDEAGGQHRAGAGVADVGAPQLLRATSGRCRRPLGRHRRERHRHVVAEDLSSGSSTSQDSTPPANMTPAIRGPMT